MKIKCPVCSIIAGSKQEYDLHCQNIHKQIPFKKEKLVEARELWPLVDCLLVKLRGLTALYLERAVELALEKKVKI